MNTQLQTTELDDMNREIQSNQPAWIEGELEVYDIASIQQGGCASGAYMPAVTYYQAKQTMAEHGDEVLDYIENELGELPQVPQGESWSGIAVFFLSYAVELWANQFDVEHLDY